MADRPASAASPGGGGPRLRLGIVGHPVSHSLSPPMHRRALVEVGLEGDYERFDAPDVEALRAVVDRVRAGELAGLNVTIPHKAAAAAMCDRLDGAAAVLGVANTLYRDGAGALVGTNTDVAGLERAIAEAWPAWRADERVVAVLGAGGAAYAALLAVDAFGPREIRLWNRTTPRAMEMADRMRDVVDAELRVVDDPIDAARDAVLVVQATSVGLATVPMAAAWRAAKATATPVMAATARDGRVYDLVYNPKLTPWTSAAGDLGRGFSSGLGMLVHQAALSFERWTGREPSPVSMLLAAQSALD